MTNVSNAGLGGREIHYRAPLGRYEGSAPAPPPANRIMVGRDRVRRIFLDWLKTRRHSGAFLITGNRGVGKSTFTDVCVEEYVRDLRTRIGTHSRAGHLLAELQMWVLVQVRMVLVPWLASEIAHALLWGQSGGRELRCLLAAPFLWVLLRPWRYVLSDCFQFWVLWAEGQLKTASVFGFRTLLLASFGSLLIADLRKSPSASPGLHVALAVLVGLSAALEFRLARFAAPILRVSLLGRFYRSWLPVLRAKVNLGFDNLDQTTVVRAMLTALVRQHRRALTGFGSPAGRLHLDLTLLSTLLIAKALIGPLTTYASAALEETSLEPFVSWSCQSWPLTLKNSLIAGRFLPFTDAVSRIDALVTPAWVLLEAALLAFALATMSSRHARLNLRARRLLLSLDNATKQESGLEFGAGTAKAAKKLTVDTAPLDPRQIEQEVLAVIGEMARPAPRLLVPRLWFAPSADIIFIFDELDKVGNHRLAAAADPGAAAVNVTSHFGSDRNRDLHRLLSEMKNLVAAAEARFIFIGGRDLNDEWLADRTARKPLLSTVFEGELYVPSLLVDDLDTLPPGEHERFLEGEQLLWRTKQFVCAHRRSAEARGKFYGKSLTLPVQSITWCPDLGFEFEAEHEWRLWRGEGRELDWIDREERSRFFSRFYRYLAVVGRGNPKTIESLLDEFVFFDEADRQHVLRFGYADRFRIAFFSRIFDRVAQLVAHRREDKVIQSAFYLTEFLFKFHRRAFHWSSLELLDELLDVHHAPDLREMMADIVHEWSQSYIVPIEAGLYRFRFGSGFAAEIRYLSRLSSSAMAAFNFTLDETYLLKREYERRLSLASARKEDEFTIRSALGELYDFDEDYEQARRHYIAAIQSLDEALTREYEGAGLKVLGLVNKTESSDVNQTEGEPKNERLQIALADLGRTQINWSVPRVFHRLRMGLTYERTGDYVDALLHYRNARTLANHVLADLLSRIPRRRPVKAPDDFSNDPPWCETTKDLQLLFEPVFACAWIAEKSRSPSSGRYMLEEGLRYSMALLGTAGEKSDFFLTRCDLHLKAGAFYLLRGRDWLVGAYSHYTAAARCVHSFLSKSADVQGSSSRDASAMARSQLVVARLAAALLGMADVCLARSAGLCTLATDAEWDPGRLETTARKIVETFFVGGDLADAPFGKVNPSYGVIAAPVSSGEDENAWAPPVELPTLPGVLDAAPGPQTRFEARPAPEPHEHFTWFVALADAAAIILRDSERTEQAERVWLTTRRSVAYAAWALRCGEYLAPEGGNLPKRLSSLMRICSMKLAKVRSKNVTSFRRRVEVGSALACQMDSKKAEELRTIVATEPYPVRAVLSMRESLLLYGLLSRADLGQDPGIANAPPEDAGVADVYELMRLAREYDSPMHFTPSSLGLVLGLWALVNQDSSDDERAVDDITSRAREELDKGIGTVTRGPGYRWLISTLFYLDDGFSDREVHVGHALQLFTLTLSQKMLAGLEEFAERRGLLQADAGSRRRERAQ